MRKLPDMFVDDLASGILQGITRMVREDSELDFQIRDKRVHIYYKGGKILGLSPKRGGGYNATFDREYLKHWEPRPEDDANLLCDPDRPDSIVTADNASVWVLAVPQLKKIMDRWFLDNKNAERQHQQKVVEQNNKDVGADDTDFFIIDIEYAKNIKLLSPKNPDKKTKTARFDMVAMSWPTASSLQTKPRLEFVELKVGDKALGGIARQELKRDPIWTESIAIGSESFVKRIEEETLNRRELTVESGPSNRWCVKEAPVAYN